MDPKLINNLFISPLTKSKIYEKRLDKYFDNQQIAEQKYKFFSVDKKTKVRKRRVYEIIQDATAPFYTKINIEILAEQLGVDQNILYRKFKYMDFTIKEAEKIWELLHEQLLNNVGIYKKRTRVARKKSY
jgi:hypothetical protein